MTKSRLPSYIPGGIGMHWLNAVQKRLIDAVRSTHRRLNVQGLDVLPVLLEERNKEVDGHRDVGHQLVLRLVNGADGNTHAQDLLQLELDGTSGLVDLGLDVLVLTKQGRELTSLVQAGAEQTGNLTNDRVRGKEEVVLLGQLLDKLLVLVEFLQSLNVHGVVVELLSLVAVGSISKNANSHTGLAWDRKLQCASETLVLLGIVVLQTDLELNGLDEPTLIVSSLLQNLFNRAAKSVRLDFAKG